MRVWRRVWALDSSLTASPALHTLVRREEGAGYIIASLNCVVLCVVYIRVDGCKSEAYECERPLQSLISENCFENFFVFVILAYMTLSCFFFTHGKVYFFAFLKKEMLVVYKDYTINVTILIYSARPKTSSSANSSPNSSTKSGLSRSREPRYCATFGNRTPSY